MNLKQLSIVILTLVFSFSNAQKTKKNPVKVDAINSKYEGETKKGLANGKGKATGTEDSYEGAFKKGYPHGEGTYTWANGNTYVGEFSKGSLNGKGKLIVLKADKSIDKIEEGYFKDNEYIGLYKDPYKIISDGGVRNTIFQKRSGELNQLTFEVFSNGVAVPLNKLEITDLNNSLVQVINNLKTISNINFPLKRVQVRFSIDNANYDLIFDLYQKGNWHLTISV
ncbi:hypothetical protein [Algibacter sp. Ld11]|uniref:hypothetical protein n=1 Tax=Algibacter sp. Ld11 TaxID=649150 RepID=UPI00386C5A9F